MRGAANRTLQFATRTAKGRGGRAAVSCLSRRPLSFARRNGQRQNRSVFTNHPPNAFAKQGLHRSGAGNFLNPADGGALSRFSGGKRGRFAQQAFRRRAL